MWSEHYMIATDSKKEDMTDRLQPVFATVAMDITSFCNLRCPFCLSNHDLPKVFMSEEVFDKAISLIPLAINNNFLFSCLYEPTLHPDFLTYLNKIPEEFRHKVFFSTNLAKKISDDILEGLSRSGLHHINISLDSLDPPTYESLRKGARFSVFHDNLNRLVNIFSRTKNAPEIFYISVVNKLNYREIPSLMEQCFTRYLGAFHDVREYWLLTHQRKLDWCVENKLSADELEFLQNSLSDLNYNFSFTEAGRDSGILLPDNNYKGEEIVDERGWRDNLYHNSYDGAGIRIHANGKVEILGRNTHFYLQDIESPVSFMADFSTFLQQDIEKTDELQRIAGRLIHNTLQIQAASRVLYSLDEVSFAPKTVQFRGWCFHQDGKKLAVHLKLPDTQEIAMEITPLSSPDVAAVHGALAAACRFELKVNLNYAYSPDELIGITFGISTKKDPGRSKASDTLIRDRIYNGTRKYLNKLIAK